MGRALSKAAGDTEVWVADSPVGPAAIHRELCRLEKWAVKEQSHTLIHGGVLQLEKPLHREGPGVLELDRSQQCAPDQADSMGCTSRGQRWPFPLLTQEQCPEWDTDTAGNPAEGHKGIWGLQHLFTRKGWGSRDCLARRKLRKTLINTLSSEGESKEDGARLLSGMGSDRTRGVAHTGTQEVPCEHKNILLLWGWLNCSRWPRDTVSFLGDPKPSGHHSGQQGLDGIAGAGGLDNMTSRGPSQPPSASDSVNKQKHQSLEKNGKVYFFFFNIKRSWTAQKYDFSHLKMLLSIPSHLESPSNVAGSKTG